MRTLEVKRDYRWHILRHYNRHAYFYDLIEFIRQVTHRKAVGLSAWQYSEKILDLCTRTGEVVIYGVHER